MSLVYTLAGPRIVRPRVDRRSWALAITSDENWWTYRDVRNPSWDTYNAHNNNQHKTNRNQRETKFTMTLLHDDSFVDERMRNELKYAIEDGFYDDEWEDHCRREAHQEGRCPHVRKQKKAYQQAFEKLFHDKEEKSEWIWRSYIQWDDIAQQIYSWDADELFYFLKDYPIDGCMRSANGEWENVLLQNIIGWCPECNAPTVAEDLCERPRHELDAAGPAEQVEQVHCPSCNSDSDIENPILFTHAHARPFDWPPGAPWPPRATFCGSPLMLGPWEE